MTTFFLAAAMVFGMLVAARPDAPLPETTAENKVLTAAPQEKPLVTKTDKLGFDRLEVKRLTFRSNKTCVIVEARNLSECVETHKTENGVPVLVGTKQEGEQWSLRYADGLECEVKTDLLNCRFK